MACNSAIRCEYKKCTYADLSPAPSHHFLKRFEERSLITKTFALVPPGHTLLHFCNTLGIGHVLCGVTVIRLLFFRMVAALASLASLENHMCEAATPNEANEATS